MPISSYSSRRMSNGLLPSPPSSPTHGKGSGSGSGSGRTADGLTDAFTPAADDQALVKALVIMSKNIGAVDKLKLVYKDRAEAREEAKALTRSLARTHAEMEVLEKKMDDCTAKLEACQAKQRKTEKTLADKTAELQKELQAKQADLAVRSKELHKVHQELEAARTKLAEAAERADQQRRDHDASMEAQRALKADLTKLETSAAELATLKSYLLPTKAMEVGDISRCLNEIFDSAYRAVYACFSQDLSDDVFAASSGDSATAHAAHEAWRTFKEAFPAIPLPASNSADAKAMRIAAVVQYLGIVAADELFQPVYMGGSGDDVGATLASIPDPKQADIVRRILLQAKAASKEAEAKRKADRGGGGGGGGEGGGGGGSGGGNDNEDDDDADDEDEDDSSSESDSDFVGGGGAGSSKDSKDSSFLERAATVVEEVLELVDGLLSPAQAATLRDALDQWSRATAAVWEAKLQPLPQRLDALPLPEPRTAAGESTPQPDHWSALVFPEPSPLQQLALSTSASMTATASAVSGSAVLSSSPPSKAQMPPSAIPGPGPGGPGPRPRSFSTTHRSPMARRGSMSVVTSGLASPLAPSLMLARPHHVPPPMAAATATATTTTTTPLPAVSPADVSFYIWPAFVLADAGDDATLVNRGLAVTKKQAACAREEDQKANAPSRTKRNMERAAHRVRKYLRG